MKSPGVIYRRYRQLKRKLLYDKLVRARQQEHGNCFYGETLTNMDGPHEIGGSWFRVCMYDYDPKTRKLVYCTCPGDCNAFANKWSKEKVEKLFEQELSDWKTKVEKYPELVALEWVLDKDLTDAIKRPRFLNVIIVAVIMFLERFLKYTNKIQKTAPPAA
jgi:hypothetical protein